MGVLYMKTYIKRELQRQKMTVPFQTPCRVWGALPSDVSYYGRTGKAIPIAGIDIEKCSQLTSSILSFWQDKSHCGDGC